MKTSQSRRNLLVRGVKGGLTLLAGASLGPVFLSACKNKTSGDQAEKKPSAQTNTCPHQDSLNEQDQAIRKSLKYVDASTIDGRTCDNCKLYTLPAPGTLCGGCKVVPGPIHPKGYCTAWLHLM